MRKERQKESESNVESALEDQFGSRRVIAVISSKPEHCDRAILVIFSREYLNST